MTKYKIKKFKCFRNIYWEVKYSIFDFLDNEIIGAILCYLFYYIISIVFIIPILIVVLIKTIKDIGIAKKHIKEDNEPFISMALKYKIIEEKE